MYMPQKIDFLTDNGDLKLESFEELSPLIPFSNRIISFLDDFSKELKNDIDFLNYPDVAALSFFCRKANLNQLKKKYINESATKLGKGTIFHIAPSNVPINFAFSLISGILMGNSNIVRLPSNQFKQINIIVDAFNRLCKKKGYKDFLCRNLLVRYQHDSEANKIFSLICDVRIIWGGDETINKIRKFQIKPYANDITFSDRYSICIINSDKFINEKNHDSIISKFYNDTYLFDQNACTSPHLIIWTGSDFNIRSAKTIFWEKLENLVKTKYKMQSINSINKLSNFCKQAIKMPNIYVESKYNNLVWRVEIDKLSNDLVDFRSNSGYFCEFNAYSIENITKFITRKFQTLSYYGFEKNTIKKFMEEFTPRGIERIVPIGSTMEFSLTWDGINLTDQLTRNIDIL